MQPYTAPTFNKSAFNCPNCHAFAEQGWFRSSLYQREDHNSPPYGHHGIVQHHFVAICSHCKKASYWTNGAMIYPKIVNAPFPNPDIPEDIKIDLQEARQISNLSPKGAAALLRLVIQKLCVHLKEPGRDLNNDIGSLVQKGLPAKIQKALDVVRVIGNESVHPGQIDINDDPNITAKLFELVNIIADTMITQPKEIDKLFEGLPEGKKAAILKRDA